MKSSTSGRFWTLFEKLPEEVRRDAKSAFASFERDPFHAGLQFKRLAGEDNIWSVRIGLGYRALGVRQQDLIVWFWIGTHAEYDRLA